MNSGGATSVAGRSKMDGAPMLLKAGTKTGSLGFGNPKLNGVTPEEKVGTTVALLLVVAPKIFNSYSTSCWLTAEI